MDNEKVREQFKRAIKYKFVGFLILLIAIIPMVMFEGTMKYIVAIIILGIGFYFERQYKCPSCGNVFDPRIKSDELIYCHKCNEKLQ